MDLEAQTLCHLCANIDTSKIHSLQPEDEAYAVTHHSHFEDLKQSAANGCSLCQLFYQEIEQYRGTKSKYFNRGQLRIVFQAVDVDGKPKVRVEYRDAAIDRHSYHLVSTSDDLNRLLTPIPDLDLCAQWLYKCSGRDVHSRAVHANCPALIETKLPSRVLSVGTAPGDSIKLVETDGAEGIYACLSHCWGTAPVTARTLRSNFEQHLQGFDLEYLPRTFRDAVAVCRALDLPYLWIDSLCIVQDDSDDWDRECVQMCSIYQNAALTIAASSSENANGGFLRVRKQSTSSPVTIPSKTPDGTAYTISSWPRSAAGSWLSSLELPPAALLERAWVVQECLLSPRMLFFHEEELYFDCFAGRFREAYPDIAHRHHPQDSFERAQYNKIALNPSSPAESEQSLVDIWFSVVHEYSLTQLSFQGDILPALSGLAKALGQRSEEMEVPLGNYAAGLWTDKDNFYKCLLWYATGKKKQYRFSCEETLPSWSWTSSHRTVDHFLHDSDKHPLYGAAIEVYSIDVQPSGLNPNGSVQPGASIRMAGYLHNYSIRPSSRWRSARNARSKRRLSVWSVETNDQPSLELASFDPDAPVFASEDQGENVTCLSVCIDMNINWYGIMLKEIGIKTYRRVGICQVDRINHLSASPEEVKLRMDMWKGGTWQEFTLM
ncbi:hypothetical protein PRZ48_003673 [Zasmidium cellare]|uniref:Heterokaryon incompatibility domain-containing protein n=1 Tax=Zasmidium cellare TaxID=395010 RepID=A0ABR0EXA6_ZASCE|nr:hypothetical protein PRZ48_003673 [Zasmidium cellare]